MRCPHCRHCESVVLPALQMLERRMCALEDGREVRLVAPPRDHLKDTERALLIHALQAAHGIQAHAAERLGISARCLHYKIGRYGLQPYCALRRRRS